MIQMMKKSVEQVSTILNHEVVFLSFVFWFLLFKFILSFGIRILSLHKIYKHDPNNLLRRVLHERSFERSEKSI